MQRLALGRHRRDGRRRDGDARHRWQGGQVGQEGLVHVAQAEVDDPRQDADQVLDRVEGDDAPLVHDGHAVAEELDLLHVVAGVDDRHAALAVEAHNRLKDIVARLGVDADGGLVQEEEAWLVEEAGGDVHAALHAARVLFHRVVSAVGKGHDAQHVGDALARGRGLRDAAGVLRHVPQRLHGGLEIGGEDDEVARSELPLHHAPSAEQQNGSGGDTDQDVGSTLQTCRQTFGFHAVLQRFPVAPLESFGGVMLETVGLDHLDRTDGLLRDVGEVALGLSCLS